MPAVSCRPLPLPDVNIPASIGNVLKSSHLPLANRSLPRRITHEAARTLFTISWSGCPVGCSFLWACSCSTLSGICFMPTDQWIMLLLLCITSLVVGILARLTRPFHAYGTAWLQESLLR